jgi:hypothetical protein
MLARPMGHARNHNARRYPNGSGIAPAVVEAGLIVSGEPLSIGVAVPARAATVDSRYRQPPRTPST